MANRRCLSKDFYYSDEFLSLPHKSIILYTYFNLSADDDGFVINPKTIMRICNAEESDVEKLVESGFLIKFDSGNLLIKHWLQHNTITKTDKNSKEGKYHPTKCIEDFSKVEPNEIKEYVLIDRLRIGSESQTERNPNLTEQNSTEENITESNTNQNNSKKSNSRKESSRENPKISSADREWLSQFDREEKNIII